MSSCGCSRRCTCTVTAGAGVTVVGNGSASAPYVISAGPSTTVLQATDTPTVDATVSGTGTVGDPYLVSATVVLDPAPPGGGANLVHAGPDGLFVECADVRTCFTATGGVAYDPGTGEFTADLSGDAGNALVLGGDGGLFVPAAEATSVEAADSSTVDATVSGTGTVGDPYVVSAEVIVDPAPPGGGTNLVHAGPDGVYVECADVRTCFTATGGVAYDPGTGEFTADLSSDAGNALVLGGDGGLFVSPGAIDCADVRPCISAGDGADYDPLTGVITADLSADPGNTIAIGTDGGLYSAGGGGGTTVVQAADTPTVDTTVSGTGTVGDPYLVSSAVVLDPAPPGGGSNLVHAGPDGVYVECADVRTCFTATGGVAYNPATGEFTADLSADAGNQLVLGGDGGLFVPEAGVETACGLTGDGTAGDPLSVATAPWPYPCSVDTLGGVVSCGSDGVLRGEPRTQVSFVSFTEQRNYADLAVPAGFDNVVDTFSTTFTNPDTCRPAMLLVERELDVDFNLPATAGAAYGQDTDEMYYTRNTGTTQINDAHVQTTKLFLHTTNVPPGGTATVNFPVTLGRGSGGATYNRIQVFLRGLMISH